MQHRDADPTLHSEFAALAARVPHSSVCLNSGLSYWDLSDELPASVHLAVPRGVHWPKIDTPATTLHRFAAETFGLERLSRDTDAGEPFSIYSANDVSSMRCACNTSSVATWRSRRSPATSGAQTASPCG
jgi:hypothetical protein